MAALAPSTSGARAALSCKQSLRAGGARLAAAAAPRAAARPSRASVAVLAYKATVQNGGETHVVEVPEGETVLSACIDAGIDVPFDCQLGTCLRCAARLVDGDMDLDAGMINPEARDKGYVLLCTSLPQSDVVVECIDEYELIDSIRA